MEIFSLNDTAKQGTIVNGIKSGVWIERYLDGGEFKFIGNDPDALREALPVDSLVGISDSYEVMVVEDHEIEEEIDIEPKITITGRGLDQVLMENRIITKVGGGDYSSGLAFPGRGYPLENHSGWYNAKELIEDSLKASWEDGDNNVFNFDVRSTVGTSDPAFLKYYFSELETLYEAVKMLLTPRNLGIRVERPNPDHDTLDFVIHEGEDLSSTINFSWFMGQVQKARYFKTSRGRINALYVYDQTATHRIYPGDETGLRARAGKLNASDLELEYSDPPTGPEILTAYDKLNDLGQAELAKQKVLQILDAEISQNAPYRYGVDFNMGDIVTVLGKYDTVAAMRVTEYARSFDETGISEYPTLTNINADTGVALSE